MNGRSTDHFTDDLRVRQTAPKRCRACARVFRALRAPTSPKKWQWPCLRRALYSGAHDQMESRPWCVTRPDTPRPRNAQRHISGERPRQTHHAHLRTLNSGESSREAMVRRHRSPRPSDRTLAHYFGKFPKKTGGECSLQDWVIYADRFLFAPDLVWGHPKLRRIPGPSRVIRRDPKHGYDRNRRNVSRIQPPSSNLPARCGSVSVRGHRFPCHIGRRTTSSEGDGEARHPN